MKYFISNLLMLSTFGIIFSGCASSISYKPYLMYGQPNNGLIYEHKAVNGDDLYLAITTVETYEFYLNLSTNKALSYTHNNGVLYLGISEGQDDIKTSKQKSLKICNEFSKKECKLHSINNKMTGVR